jgi:hypothetical protein
MATYNGIFMRSALNQSNIVPRAGAQSGSPDIIPYGLQPPKENPETFFRSNYDKDVGQLLYAKQTNLIYLRGKNYSGETIDDKDATRPHLYWTKASLLSYPDDWTELTATGSGNPPTLRAGAGEIGVINEPFLWKPDDIVADHYCMIAQVPSPGYDNSIPNTTKINDLAAWVAKSGGVAWRNVTIVNADRFKLTGERLHYIQGSEASAMEFSIKCTNIPIGSRVSFFAPVPGPVPPIALDWTTVSTYPSFSSGIESDVPAGYISDVYFNMEAPEGVKELPDGAKIAIQAFYTVSQENPLYAFAKTRAELGIPSVDEAYAVIMRSLIAQKKTNLEPYHEHYLDQLSKLYVRQPLLATADRKIIVGQNIYEWKKF